jgi:Secretion system C-terminal sorting domain
MKKNITVLMVFILTGSLTKGFSQSIAPSIINSGGGSAPAGNYFFEFNLGELMATGTAITSNLIVTQGFLQPLIPQLGPLPITLLNFQGVKKSRYNELNWATSYETGSTKFELQRSDDGRTFTTIYTTPAHGLANGSNYSYNDYQPFTKNVYYRLQITEAGLADKFSQIIVLHNEEKNNWIVYPNPVNRGAALQISIENAGVASNASIIMIDAVGRKVLERKEAIVTGSQTISLPMQLPPGMYTLSIIGLAKNNSQKIIIQ